VAWARWGIGLDYGGFGIQALPGGHLERIFSAYPRLKMKQRFADTCCRLVTEKPETSYDNFCATSASGSSLATRRCHGGLLMNAPFDEIAAAGPDCDASCSAQTGRAGRRNAAGAHAVTAQRLCSLMSRRAR